MTTEKTRKPRTPAVFTPCSAEQVQKSWETVKEVLETVDVDLGREKVVPKSLSRARKALRVMRENLQSVVRNTLLFEKTLRESGREEREAKRAAREKKKAEKAAAAAAASALSKFLKQEH